MPHFVDRCRLETVLVREELNRDPTHTDFLPTFMEVLHTAIAAVILPHIAGSLSASTDEATWVLTSYLV